MNTIFLVKNIEGLNVSDLLWGTANAKSITLSFWVKSSLTGTFAVVVGAQGTNVYPASFTINTANLLKYTQWVKYFGLTTKSNY